VTFYWREGVCHAVSVNRRYSILYNFFFVCAKESKFPEMCQILLYLLAQNLACLVSLCGGDQQIKQYSSLLIIPSLQCRAIIGEKCLLNLQYGCLVTPSVACNLDTACYVNACNLGSVQIADVWQS